MLQCDEWLSQYFAPGSAYRYLKPFDTSNFPKGFIYAKVQADEIEVFNDLVGQGLRIVEVSLGFVQQKSVDQYFEDTYTCRFANDADKEQVAQIAKNAFTCSRFYRDPNILHSLASKIKEDWVANYFLGKRGTHMIVAELNSELCGFMLMIDQVIDLVGVDQNHLRKGIATKMIAFANKQIGLLKVGTQSSNGASVKLYQNAGFTLDQAQLVLHKHVG
jgi:ribosomal protein S18 acetylase RimI-like enzyme